MNRILTDYYPKPIPLKMFDRRDDLAGARAVILCALAGLAFYALCWVGWRVLRLWLGQ